MNPQVGSHEWFQELQEDQLEEIAARGYFEGDDDDDPYPNEHDDEDEESFSDEETDTW